MKNILLIVGTLLMIGLLAGCGIPQEQYNTALGDLGKAQQEIQSVKAELATTQTRVTDLTSGQAKAKTDLETAQTDLKTAQAKASQLTSDLGKSQTDLKAAQDESKAFKSDLATGWSRFEKLSALQLVLTEFWSAAARQESPSLFIDLHAKIGDKLTAIGDDALNTSWKDARAAMDKNDGAFYLKNLTAIMDRNNKLFQDEANLLKAKILQ